MARTESSRNGRRSPDEPPEASIDPLGGGAGDDRGEGGDGSVDTRGSTPHDDLATRLDVDPERGDVKG